MRCNKVNRREGIRRIVFVISIIVVILGVLIYIKFTNDTILWWKFLIGLICFAFIVVVYTTVLWIIDGFRDEKNQDDNKV
jgi:ABC-type lipoprotein release transport system permease subunit